MRRVSICAAIACVVPVATLAQDASVDTAALDRYAAATIRAPGKSYFLRDARACPAATASCRTKAYVVAGDAVLIDARRGAFVAASFVDPRGRSTRSWLPAGAVAATRAGTPDWIGTWRRNEAEIAISSAGRAGAVTLAGSATYGARDPRRVANGAVNTGQFGGEAVPHWDRIVHVEDECRVTLRRVGAYLVAADNMGCGGLNVSFSGVYRRIAKGRAP